MMSIRGLLTKAGSALLEGRNYRPLAWRIYPWTCDILSIQEQTAKGNKSVLYSYNIMWPFGYAAIRGSI